MTKTIRYVLYTTLVSILVLQSIVLIRTARVRSEMARSSRELYRLRSEIGLWAGSETIRPGMSTNDVIAILGVPNGGSHAMRGGSLRMMYYAKPEELFDSKLHIEGCIVVLSNEVVRRCYLSTTVLQ